MANKFLPSFRMFVQLPPVAPLDYAGSTNNINATFAGENQVTKWKANEEFIEIAFPLTIEFDIQKSTTSDANSALFSIYNLNAKNRSLIVKDRFTQNDLNIGLERRKVIFQSGYGGKLTTTFFGNLIEGYTERKGVDFITKIEVQDGAYEMYNAISSLSVDKTTTQAQLLDVLIKDLDLKRGYIGDVFEKILSSRGKSINGNTYEAIQAEIGDKVFVDNGLINALNVNEYIAGDVFLIDSNSGLLGIPKRTGGLINVDLMYEPLLILGQIVEIKSEFDSRFDGQYKIMAINHSGTISGAVEGNRITSIQLLIGTANLGGLKEVKIS